MYFINFINILECMRGKTLSWNEFWELLPDFNIHAVMYTQMQPWLQACVYESLLYFLPLNRHALRLFDLQAAASFPDSHPIILNLRGSFISAQSQENCSFKKTFAQSDDSLMLNAILRSDGFTWWSNHTSSWWSAVSHLKRCVGYRACSQWAVN